MEYWKPIPGYEGLYEASTDGRIRTAEGKKTSNARYAIRIWKQRILSQKSEARKSGGHRDFRLSLWKDGKESTLLVSRLVALTWCDGYEEGLTVNHIDGNPENNASNNLEWVSLKDNIVHGFRTGLYPQKRCTLTTKDGSTFRFSSLAQASVFLNRNRSYVHGCVKRGRSVKATDGTIYSIAF